MILTTIGSVVAIVVSLIGATVTLLKTFQDRKRGIADAQMNDARVTMDSVKMLLDARDSFIDQLQEENARLRELLRDLESR